MLEHPVMQVLIAHLGQGVLLISVTFLLTRLFGQGDAGLRHRLWIVTMVLLVGLPFLTFMDMPRLAGTWNNAPTEMATIQPDPLLSPASGVLDRSMPARNLILPPDAGRQQSALVVGVALLWILGALTRLRLVLRDVRTCRNLVRAAGETPAPYSLLPRHWPRHVPVVMTDAVTTPMMVGFWRPRVLMPTRFLRSLPIGQVRSILFHELAHIERRDSWIALAEQTLSALLWWSPWMVIVSRRIRFERELACDDIAVAKTGDAPGYARAIVEGASQVANVAPTGQDPALAMGVFGSDTSLTERIKRLTEQRYVPVAAARKPLALASLLIMSFSAAGIAVATPGTSTDRQETQIASNPIVISALQRAFVEAAGEGGPEDLAALIKAGAVIDGISPGDGTALIAAVGSGRWENVDFLIGQGADVNAPARGDGNPLIAASGNGRTDLVLHLLDLGADVDAIVYGDETALITAARNGRLETVRALVERGADVTLGVDAPTVAGHEWRTPLGEARKHERSDIARYLIDSGAAPK